MSETLSPDEDAAATQLGLIADEFTEALQRGDRPDVEAFAQRYPDLAGVLREVLPALQVMQTPAPAPTALGDFRIVREIGRGGMGIVYEAEQVSLGRRVALKVLPAHPALGDQHLARFQREAQTASQLHHTNIVPVLAVGAEQGVHYYAMQLIDGHGLDRVIRDRLPLSQARPLGAGTAPPSGGLGDSKYRAIARLGVQVADALDYAHKRGVIHRDIKPSNLILDRSGIVWISDFGLVKHLEDSDNLTRTGDLVGTARYMSPEQAAPRRGPVDARSDIHALGATLYELLTLLPAFPGDDQATILRHIAEEEPTPPRRLDRAIPRDLETIVLKALAKDPQRRYTSAAAMASDLRRLVAGEPILARPIGILERSWKWAKRRPAAAAILAVALLAAAVLQVVILRHGVELGQANERERQRAQEAEERERIGRRHLYAAHMTLAQQAWERGHAARVRTLLDRDAPRPGQEDLRGFEWRYFHGLSNRERASWLTGKHAVSAVAYSPKGDVLATGSYDRSVRLWDPQTGKELRLLGNHRGPVTALAWLPDGASIITGGLDQAVKVWNVADSKELATLPQPDPVRCLAVSADHIAVGLESGLVRLLDPRTRQEVDRFSGVGPVGGVALAPDGKALAAGIGKQVRVWPLANDTDPVYLDGHQGDIRSLAFSPDGKTLATGSADQTIKLWDVATRKERATLRGHLDAVASVAFSADGTLLASGAGDVMSLPVTFPARSRATQLREKPGEIKLWDVAVGQERVSLRGHASPVFSVAFDPRRSGTLASGGEDMTVILWDVADVPPQVLAGHGGDPKKGKEVNCVAFAPDGTLASVSDDQTVRLWDRATGREERRLTNHKAPVKAVAFRGPLMATGAGDKTIKLWDKGPATLTGHTQTLRALAFSPDGRTLASGAGDFAKENPPGEAKLWDVATRSARASLPGHTDLVRTVAFSPDGATLATGGDDKTVRLWDPAVGQHRQTIDGLPFAARHVAFSPDGSTLAIACGGVWDAHEPGAVLLWDLAQGKTRAVLRGHRAAVMVAVYAPDGRTLATGSTDGAVKLWDPITGQERCSLDGHKGLIRTAAFSPDGQMLATGDSEGVIRLWWGK